MKPIHRKVLQMREQEKSYSEIIQETGLSKAAVSYIITKYFPKQRNTQLIAKNSRAFYQSDDFKRAQKIRREAADAYYQAEHDRLKSTYLLRMREFPDQAFIFYVSGLYQGEGRHTGTNVEFCNSDSTLILPFLCFLRRVLCLSEKQFTLRLALHASLDKEECVRYWQDACDHAVDAVDQYDNRPQKKIHRHNKGDKFYGTLTVRVRKPNGLKSALKEYTY